jgi:hypothetical protein
MLDFFSQSSQPPENTSLLATSPNLESPDYSQIQRTFGGEKPAAKWRPGRPFHLEND